MLLLKLISWFNSILSVEKGAQQIKCIRIAGALPSSLSRPAVLPGSVPVSAPPTTSKAVAPLPPLAPHHRTHTSSTLHHNPLTHSQPPGRKSKWAGTYPLTHARLHNGQGDPCQCLVCCALGKPDCCGRRVHPAVPSNRAALGRERGFEENRVGIGILRPRWLDEPHLEPSPLEPNLTPVSQSSSSVGQIKRSKPANQGQRSGLVRPASPTMHNAGSQKRCIIDLWIGSVHQ